jgi:two-component system, sensor histidine kinase PdtaS
MGTTAQVLLKAAQSLALSVQHSSGFHESTEGMMSDSISARGDLFQFPQWGAVAPSAREQRQREALTGELHAALAREEVWLREKHELLRRQDMLAQEFEHRLINSLQLITSLLSLQSRGAEPEAAFQLAAAARRVAALGRVHRRLHLLDHQKMVEFKQYLEPLCEDLSDLLLGERAGGTILVEGAKVEIPTEFAVPLGFILNEMITNSAKYAEGDIIVQLKTITGGAHSLSVLDEGPGLPAGFDPTKSKGLGMKIMLALVKQIGGALTITPRENGRGSRFTVTFCTPQAAD